MRKFIMAVAIALGAAVPVIQPEVASAHSGVWHREVVGRNSDGWHGYSYYLCTRISNQKAYELRASGHRVYFINFCDGFGPWWVTDIHYYHA